LNELGFGEVIVSWHLHVIWDERLEALKAFQQEPGHCRVPGSRWKDSETYQQANKLGVSHQRRQYMNVRLGKKSQITDERIHKLKEIDGFYL
jgi:hypothetical protein